MNGTQCRMARAALNITVRDLAELAGVSHDTVVRIEGGQDLKSSTVAKVVLAFEAAGVIFVAENGDGPGVRLRKIAMRVTGEHVGQRHTVRDQGRTYDGKIQVHGEMSVSPTATAKTFVVLLPDGRKQSLTPNAEIIPPANFID